MADDSSTSGAGVAIQIGQSVLGIVGGLLAQHTARLHGAQDENQAVAQTVPAWDADLAEIVSAYDSGEADQAHALDALNTVDQQIYGYLRSLVGKPGTSWIPGGTSCGKKCTVGCCIYYSFLRPDIIVLEKIFQQGNGTWNASPIPSNKYGFPGRPSYRLDVIKPSAEVSAVKGIESSLSGLFGGGDAYSRQFGAASNPAKLALYVGGGILLFAGFVAVIRK